MKSTKNEMELNQGGVNGSGDQKMTHEEYLALRRVMMAASRKLTPEERRKTTLYGWKLKMIDYLEAEEFNFKRAGEFLSDILVSLRIKKGIFANYINIQPSNLSAIFVGKRKINNKMAKKLEAIFDIEIDLWLKIQFKNDLERIKSLPPAISYKLSDLMDAKKDEKKVEVES